MDRTGNLGKGHERICSITSRCGHNRERRHSTLGYLSPADYQERRFTREVRNAS
jgi:transposase InsO family protein